MTTAAVPPIVLTDPTKAPTYGDGPLSRWCKKALYDPRDEVFVRLSIQIVVVMGLAMVGLQHWFRWWLVPAYYALWAWYAPQAILMLHCTMHRPFIRRPKWIDRAHPYVFSFVMGIPAGYASHHMGMHHVEDNMGEDLSSTLRYQRDSFLHFLHYFGRFFFFSYVEIILYLTRKRRVAMARKTLMGEIAHFAAIGFVCGLDWRFGVVVLVVPYITVRLLMMIGNWGQHAFINTARANNGLANSITCINSGYNQRAFNDGYHVGHHLKANRHWTEMPQDFLDNQAKYAREGVIVFQGIDFFLVSVLLWTGQWRTLAKCYVRLDGKARSDEEVIAMLKSRVQPVQAEVWEASLEQVA